MAKSITKPTSRLATKPVTFIGSSLADLREFPSEARRAAGFQIDKLQNGDDPDDWKPMPSGRLHSGIWASRRHVTSR